VLGAKQFALGLRQSSPRFTQGVGEQRIFVLQKPLAVGSFAFTFFSHAQLTFLIAFGSRILFVQWLFIIHRTTKLASIRAIEEPLRVDAKRAAQKSTRRIVPCD